MIIGLGLICAAEAAGGGKAPDPASFAIRMEAGDIEQATAWLDAGLEPNFVGDRIGSGLMIGAWEGNFELMRLFLARGADLDRVNAAGESALALAAWKGRLDVVQWLVERGARINAGKRLWSALHYAVFAGHKEIADYLIARGADIDARSSNGSSVLMMAIYEGHEELARSLIEKGADRAVKNDWGDGALEWAMRGNRLKLARMVTSPEEFNIAVAQPKEKWGEPKRSFKSSAELEDLLRMREILAQRSMNTSVIDNRIAAERARIVRTELNRNALPPRAATLEISASRKAPGDQSAKLVVGEDGKPSSHAPGSAQGYKVPAARFSGQARMPPKAPVKNY